MWLPQFPATLLDTTIDRGSLFILQVWHELLLPTSPDSFQCRTLDLPLLLEDLLHVASVATHDSRWQSHLTMLGAELGLLMEEEERLLQADPKLRYALDQVSSATKGTIDPAQLRRKIEVAVGVFGDAPKRLIQDAKNLASKGKLPKSALELIHK